MIPNNALINALRDLDYHFKRQADRVVFYKKRGNTSRVAVRRIEMHDTEAVKTLLKQAGMSPQEIEKFVVNYSKK